jgi:putative tricarboxylic transport membrane protein
MVLFGAIGYALRKLRYDGAPFLLALVLGPLLETSFRQSLIIGSPAIFFERPISAALLGVALLLLTVGPLLQWRKRSLDSVLM